MGKLNFALLVGILGLLNSCVPPLMVCRLMFTNYEKVYEFDYSKQELRKQIIEAYTYDETLLKKNFGLTLIENEDVNTKYDYKIWLHKGNWDNFKTDIENNTTDTLHLSFGKHWSFKQLNCTAIIGGNDDSSTLTIKDVKYYRKRSCEKEQDFYKVKLTKKIEKKLINKIR